MKGGTGEVEAGVYEDADVLVVAFRYPESGSTIEFQSCLGEPDSQDVDLGMDTYCVVVDGGATVYGGVVDWSLADGTLAFTLEECAAETLGMTTEIRVQVDPAYDHNVLAAALEQVLGPSLLAVKPNCFQPVRVARLRFLTGEEGGRTTDPMSGVRPVLALGDETVRCLVTTGERESIRRGVWTDVMLQPVFPVSGRAFARLKEVRLYDGSQLVAVGEFSRR